MWVAKQKARNGVSTSHIAENIKAPLTWLRYRGAIGWKGRERWMNRRFLRFFIYVRSKYISIASS